MFHSFWCTGLTFYLLNIFPVVFFITLLDGSLHCMSFKLQDEKLAVHHSNIFVVYFKLCTHFYFGSFIYLLFNFYQFYWGDTG